MNPFKKVNTKFKEAIRDKAISRAETRIVLAQKNPEDFSEEQLEVIVQEEEAKIERERRMSRSSHGKPKSPQKDDVDAGKKLNESPAGKGANAHDVQGGKTPDDPLQSVMATMRVQKAASKILRCLRRYRDAKQAKQGETPTDCMA